MYFGETFKREELKSMSRALVNEELKLLCCIGKQILTGHGNIMKVMIYVHEL